MDVVHTLAQRTLVSKAKTWYVGANVKDKPQGLTIFTGGFKKYQEYCAAAAEQGYRGFSFESIEGFAREAGHGIVGEGAAPGAWV
jgi:hypothetical protein